MAGLVNGSKVFFRRHGSTVLTCLGAAGVIGTSVLTAQATSKASQLLTEAKIMKGEKLTNLEKIKVAGPSYIPALLLGTATITCIFGANALNKKQQASLASGYILLNEQFKAYKKKVTDLYGEEANDKVDQAIFEETNKKPDGEQVELFYDRYSDRYFESTMFKVQQAEYFLNRELMMKDYAYLNEWYELLEIDTTDEGWKFGWSIGLCMDCYWQPWLDFCHNNIELDDGRKCHVIDFFQEPVEDFEDYC